MSHHLRAQTAHRWRLSALAATLWIATTSLAAALEPIECHSERRERYLLTQVGERVYELRALRRGGGAPRKPITWVLTDEGVLVFDTSDKVSAQMALELIRRQTDQPIRYIVYSHHHGTQLGGAPLLRQPETEVLAHRDLPLQLDLRKTMLDYFNRLNMIQFNLAGPPPTKDRVYPDRTYDTELDLELGGVRIELRHVEGEASDYTILQLPEEKIAVVADMLANGMPMVASPMKTVRDEVKWKQSLEYVRALQPRALLFSGSTPYCDREKIDEHLTAHIDFFAFLHEGIAASLNLGLGVEDAVAAIELPSELRESPFLRERYATLEFGVRGLHHRYSGWFDQNGSSLPLVRPGDRDASFVAAMGGPKSVLTRAVALRLGGNGPLALQYLDLVIAEGSLETEARTQKAAILEQLGSATRQGIERNIYRHLAKRERAEIEAAKRPAVDEPTRRRSIAGVVAQP